MSQNTSTAVMQRRVEPDDSLDFFPTQPWATRALMEHVILPQLGAVDRQRIGRMRVWDPACGEGDMARPLGEYFGRVSTSDIFDYSMTTDPWCQDRVVDFLWPGSEGPLIEARGCDFIITNPPFRLAEQFIKRARQVPGWQGTAMLVRTAFLEGVGRYERIYKVNPPTIVAQFTERLPMVKGKLTATGSTATAYCWLVWLLDRQPQPMMWIPPCRKQLERPGDYPE